MSGFCFQVFCAAFLSGAIRQTANNLHNQKQNASPQNQNTEPISETSSNQNFSGQAKKLCSGCGELIEILLVRYVLIVGLKLNRHCSFSTSIFPNFFSMS
ncbi:hypothetical protein NEF87_004861 [Candidatus Lokiarchaeum ossiferum]|uniref:Secreted protein n=1 Tax=Candidatus Lokiarchaeum ossiferum TaxID=2951803 RepID=A0ABY6HZ04_9ARCH|nr:hypothetical protein NEF87_004861 [Candidatus Lokiarchaeum sp. B-35]